MTIAVAFGQQLELDEGFKKIIKEDF